MKKLAFVLAAALCASAWAQPAKEPAKAPAKPPEAQEMVKPAAAVAKRAPNPRRGEDARHCLDKGANADIIKCAEAYL